MTTTVIADSQATENPAVELSRPAQLLLIRLLIQSRTPPAPASVLKQLQALLPTLTVDAFGAIRRELETAGMLETAPAKKRVKKKKGADAVVETIAAPVQFLLRLNGAGRATAMKLAGIEELASSTTWTRLRDSVLFPMTAAEGAQSADARNRLVTAKLPAVELIKLRFALRPDAGSTVSKVLDALAFKELGFPQITDWKTLRAAVLNRALGNGTTIPAKEIDKQFHVIKFGLKDTKDNLRQAVIRQWAGEGTVPSHFVSPAPDRPAEPEDALIRPDPLIFEMPAFSAKVKELSRSSPTGWFGDNKVFINHAWREFHKTSDGLAMDLPTFKTHLIVANREGLLQLSRADLVGAMEPADVAESETRYLNAEFHFIFIEGDKK